jgi:segregation and condensation protein A
MTDQVFELENFRGPMDLLLHLIREQEMEILDVDLSKLCDQYLAAVELMQAVDINVAGEFLVMASTLILIKSRSILPREEEIDLEEELDPGDELIQQLLEYRKFKSLSMELGDRATEAALRHPRGASEVPPDPGTELEEIGLWDLVGSFVRLMEELGLKRDFHTLTLEKPLREYMRDTLRHLASSGEWTLKDLIVQAGGGEQVLGVFLSLLELVKTQQVVVKQAATREPITVALREDRDPSLLHFPVDEELPKPETAQEDEPRPPAHPLPDEDAAEDGDDTNPDLAASDEDSIVFPFLPQADEATGG